MPRGKTPEVLALIDACVRILEQIQPASVRAVCYQLFVRGWLESMAKTCTNRISRHLVYAREQEMVPWEWIVDETREADKDAHYQWYRTSHGARTWELDGLNPNVLRAVVEDAIRGYINWAAWEQSSLAEQAETESLQHILRSLDRTGIVIMRLAL
jgi:hypothetical protein